MLAVLALAASASASASVATQPAPARSAPPSALLGAAVQSLDAADYCGALHYYSALNERWPSARALYNAAEVAYAAGDRARALELYREQQRLYPAFEKKDAVKRRIDEVFRAMVDRGPGVACPQRELDCGDWRVTVASNSAGLLPSGDARPEQCDDGNTVDGDGCDANCQVTACGNGRVTAGEQCDDGNTTDGDGCDANCTRTSCGNGTTTAGEQCDDGNAQDGDGCDHTCSRTACGNGLRTKGEQCDDGNDADGDGCDRGCLVSRCGNGIKAGSEVCDDGNTHNDDGCETDCTITRRPAPIPGLITASAGALGLVGAGFLVTAGVEPLSRYDAAAARIDAAETSYAAEPNDGALDDARTAHADADAALSDWQGGGALAVGAAGALGVLSIGAVGAGIAWALLATEEVVPEDTAASEVAP